MPRSDIPNLIADLRECSRYVKTNVPVAQASLIDIIARITLIPSPRIDRLVGNLVFAREFIQVEPDMCLGYILGAAFELECIGGDA